MIVSRKIISQWLNINSIKDYEIVDALNSLGFEVDQVKKLMFSNTNLVVGQITKITKHPKSNKLNICEVTVGTEMLTIVCGASNVVIGIKVVVARIGSTLGNGLTIVERTIQDVVSSGMLCSLTELGLSGIVQNKEELSGIIHLPDDAMVGNINPLQYLNLDDTIFFIDLTVNRSDCLGIYSIARELSGYFKIPLKNMEVSSIGKFDNKSQVSVLNGKIQALATLKIEFDDKSVITPIWIRRTLQLANIVPKTLSEDIIHLVMLELGQPLITFSADVLKKPSLNISPKSYPEGNLQIKEGDILLHDKYLAFSVLGVIHNIEYEVKSSSKEVFIFSINPDVTLMSKQAKRHGVLINTLLERLTRPVVPDYYLIALQRYLFILRQLQVKYEITGFSNDVPYQVKTKVINFNFNFINKILGTNFGVNEIINYLTIIGCQIEIDVKNQEILKVTVPNHRSDLNNANDFSEEVARVFGYDKLPVIKPQFNVSFKSPTTMENLMMKWRQHLTSYGFNQVKTYSLTSMQRLNDFNFFKYKIPVKLEAPLTLTRKVMRFSLTDSLLRICQYNYARKETQLKIFTDEIIYTGDETDDNHHLAFMIMDNFWPKINTNKITNSTYYFIKGFLDGFLAKVMPNLFNSIVYKTNNNSLMHPYLSADIFYEQEHIATIGALHPQTEKIMNVEKIFLAEINCSKLVKIIEEQQKVVSKFKLWSKFNALSRDISIIVNSDIQFSDVKNAIIFANIHFLEQISLVDFYNDEKLKSQHQHSLTFNLKFNSQEEQLDETKVSGQISIIQEILKKKFQAIIR